MLGEGTVEELQSVWIHPIASHHQRGQTEVVEITTTQDTIEVIILAV